MVCKKCAGQGKLNYNPFQYPTDIHPCKRCGGSGVEPYIAIEDYVALTKEIDRLKAELMDAKVRGNAFRDVAKKLKAEIELNDAGLKAILELIESSGGVYGLHLNGDNASWESLRIGGSYEEWLTDFDEALAEPEEDGE